MSVRVAFGLVSSVFFLQQAGLGLASLGTGAGIIDQRTHQADGGLEVTNIYPAAWLTIVFWGYACSPLNERGFFFLLCCSALSFCFAASGAWIGGAGDGSGDRGDAC